VHFAVIGVVLFTVYSGVQPEGQPADRVIDIDRHEVARLVAQWEVQWRRPPTEDELARLVDARVQEEMLFREALTQGLDQGDGVIRRRLGQKLIDAWADLASLRIPTDEELAAFHTEYSDRYRVTAELTLAHRFFSRDKRGADTDASAAAALARLRAGAAVEDDPFPRPKTLMLPSAEPLLRDFGTAFRDAVVAAAAAGRQDWFGPVASDHGLHLVRIHTYTPSRQRPLAEARDEVHLDWQQREIEQDRARRLAELSASFEVRVAALDVAHAVGP